MDTIPEAPVAQLRAAMHERAGAMVGGLCMGVLMAGVYGLAAGMGDIDCCSRSPRS